MWDSLIYTFRQPDTCLHIPWSETTYWTKLGKADTLATCGMFMRDIECLVVQHVVLSFTDHQCMTSASSPKLSTIYVPLSAICFSRPNFTTLHLRWHMKNTQNYSLWSYWTLWSFVGKLCWNDPTSELYICSCSALLLQRFNQAVFRVFYQTFTNQIRVDNDVCAI